MLIVTRLKNGISSLMMEIMDIKLKTRIPKAHEIIHICTTDTVGNTTQNQVCLFET